MFTTILSTTVLFLLSASGALAGFAISTVNLTECSSAHITWSAANPPYNLAVVPESDPCNTIAIDLGDHNGTSMTWPNITLPAGTQVLFSLLDANDEEAWSQVMTVAAGDCSKSASSSLSATTLVLSNTVDTAAATGSPAASALGAANAGILPASGALSSAHLSVGATVFASLMAAAAALAL